MASSTTLRTRPQGSSTSAAVRAQRRRAVLFDDGMHISCKGVNESRDDAGYSFATGLSSASAGPDVDPVTYFNIPRGHWDGLIAPSMEDNNPPEVPPKALLPPSSASARPPRHSLSIKGTTPDRSSSVLLVLTNRHEDNSQTTVCGSRRRNTQSTTTSGVDSRDSFSLAPLTATANDWAEVVDQPSNPAAGSGEGRWVLDRRAGFEMFVPSTSPRRRLRPRLRSVPGPSKDNLPIPITKPLPERPRLVLKRNRTTTDDEDAPVRQQRPSELSQAPLPSRLRALEPLIPPSPSPSPSPVLTLVPPSLAPFVDAINARDAGYSVTVTNFEGNEESAPFSFLEVPGTPNVPPTPATSQIQTPRSALFHDGSARRVGWAAEEQESHFQALIARDCPDENLACGPLSPTAISFNQGSLLAHRGASPGGIGGKWSSGLPFGIPNFFRARRNTTAGGA